MKYDGVRIEINWNAHVQIESDNFFIHRIWNLLASWNFCFKFDIAWTFIYSPNVNGQLPTEQIAMILWRVERSAGQDDAGRRTHLSWALNWSSRSHSKCIYIPVHCSVGLWREHTVSVVRAYFGLEHLLHVKLMSWKIATYRTWRLSSSETGTQSRTQSQTHDIAQITQ